MKLKKMKRIFLMLLINLCPAALGVLCYVGGFLSFILVILLTPVAIWLNQKLTSGCKKMLLWDGLYLVASGAGIIFSSLLYWWNISADNEGILVTQFFLIVWFGVCILSILASLIWLFRAQKKRKQESVVCGVMALCIVLIAVYGYMAFTLPKYAYTGAWFYNDNEIVSDERYEAEIRNEGDIGDEEVVIRDRTSGNETKFTTKELGIYPQQIALGEEHFYILGGDDYDDYDRIAKITYEGQTVAERSAGEYIALSQCRDGVLFLKKETDEEENPDVPGQMYASRYIKETDFEQGEIMSCKADKEGICHVGNVDLYDHGAYFSTNPLIESYEESNSYHFLKRYEETKPDQTRWTELVEKMLADKGLVQYSRDVDEYQNGNYLYGVVNVWHSFLGVSERRLKESIAYRISCETGEISVLAEKKNVYMVITSEDYIVYQDDKTLMRENISDGQTEELARLYSDSNSDFQICGQYMKVENEQMEDECVQWCDGFDY